MRRGITTRAEQRKSDVRVIKTYETTLSQKIKSKSKLCTHASSQLRAIRNIRERRVVNLDVIFKSILKIKIEIQEKPTPKNNIL